MAKNGSPNTNLDERIATALATPPDASALFELIIEVTTAIEDADAAGRVARAQSIDPKRADGIAFRGKAEDGEFRAARWRNGLAALQELHGKGRAREEAAAWRARADQVQELRDQLVEEFTREYPATVAKLVDLFNRVVAVDRAVDAINQSAPDCEDSHRLRHVEAAARRNDMPLIGEASILGFCRLPNFDQFRLSLAWPPAAQPVNLGMVSDLIHNGSSDPSEDRFYETIFDEESGAYKSVRRSDAPPLTLVQPSVMDPREQALAAQAARGEEEQRRAEEGRRREREREAIAARERLEGQRRA